jgi:hypothetical protein
MNNKRKMKKKTKKKTWLGHGARGRALRPWVQCLIPAGVGGGDPYLIGLRNK